VDGKSLQNVDAAVVVHDCWVVSNNHRRPCFNFSITSISSRHLLRNLHNSDNY
jgi:hypothetical protein